VLAKVQRTVIFVILREIATNIAVLCTFIVALTWCSTNIAVLCTFTFTKANSLVFYYKYFGALHLFII
jgi:hypothetical protein